MPPIAPDPNGRRYTWDDYRTWPEGARFELIDGHAFAMLPGRSTRHQWIVRRLVAQLDHCLEGKKCQPFMAPADVHLANDDVVEPDLFVVCDPKQVCETHVEGAPTIVIEVILPSSVVHDRKRKMALYAAHGVKEFWLVTPHPPLIEVFTLDDGRYYSSAAYGENETVVSGAVPAISIELARVFTFPLPPEDRIQLVEKPPHRMGRGSLQTLGTSPLQLHASSTRSS